MEARIKRIWNPKGNNRKPEAKKKNTEKLERKNYTKSLTKGEIKGKLKASKKLNRKAVKNKMRKTRKKKKLANLQSGATCKKKQTRKTQSSMSYRQEKEEIRIKEATTHTDKLNSLRACRTKSIDWLIWAG
jgi:hypothetical protein